MPAKTKVKKTVKQKQKDVSIQAQFVLLAVMGLSLSGMLFAYAVLAASL